MIEPRFGSFDNRFPYLNYCDIRCDVWVRNAEGHLVLNNNAVLDEMIKPHFFDDDDNNTLWEDEEHFDDEYNKIDNTSLNMFWQELTGIILEYHFKKGLKYSIDRAIDNGITVTSFEHPTIDELLQNEAVGIMSESYEQFIREYRIKMRVPHDFAPY